MAVDIAVRGALLEAVADQFFEFHFFLPFSLSVLSDFSEYKKAPSRNAQGELYIVRVTT